MNNHVLAISNREGPGVLFDGQIPHPEDLSGPLALYVLRYLRGRGIELEEGDLLFFPDAAPGHREVEIYANGGLRRTRGWSGGRS